jgi:hypothetical protein
MAEEKDKLVLNVGALLGSCRAIYDTEPATIKTFGLGSRINTMRAFVLEEEIFPRMAQAAVVRQFGSATARTGQAGADLKVSASKTDVSVSVSKGQEPQVATVVKFHALTTDLEIGQVISAKRVLIEASLSFDAQLQDATIALSGAFEGLTIGETEFSVEVRSEVAKPLWNPSDLKPVDTKKVVFAAPYAGLRGTLQASQHPLATVSCAAPGVHAGTDLPRNVVKVARSGYAVGQVVIGDLLVMRDSSERLWLELAAIRAEFTQLINFNPAGGGGTHDDGAHGGPGDGGHGGS